MKLHFYRLISLLVMAAFLFQCKKEEGTGAHFRVSLRQFNSTFTTSAIDLYCLITRPEDGSVVASQRFSVGVSSEQTVTFQTENASASELYDVTVFSNYAPPYWAAYTWRKVPSGAVLSRLGFIREVGGTGVYLNTTVTGVPELDSIEVPGGFSDILIYPSGTTVSVLGGATTGGSGILLRLLPKGQQDWKAFWQPYTSLDPLNTSIPFGQFRSDFPKRNITLPHPSATWEYYINGVVQEYGMGIYGNLQKKSSVAPGDPEIQTVTFEDPEALNARLYNIIANDRQRNSYNFLLPAENLTVPEIDFGVTQLTLQPVGNSYRLTAVTSGQFDMLTAQLYGSSLFTNWFVYGSPEDLADYTLPVWPTNWPLPKFLDSGVVYPVCDDYKAYSGFQEVVMNYRLERFWQARSGWRQHSGI